MSVVALAHHDALESLSLFIGCDFARNSRMVHGRHVYQEPSRQSDMASDARALFADRLFRNLHQNFLAFLQQIADLRNLLRFATWKAATATAPASATPAVETGPRTRRSLRVTGRCRGSTNLSPRIYRARAPRLRVEQGFCLSLCLLEFQFLGVFLGFGCALRRHGTRLR